MMRSTPNEKFFAVHIDYAIYEELDAFCGLGEIGLFNANRSILGRSEPNPRGIFRFLRNGNSFSIKKKNPSSSPALEIADTWCTWSSDAWLMRCVCAWKNNAFYYIRMLVHGRRAMQLKWFLETKQKIEAFFDGKKKMKCGSIDLLGLLQISARSLSSCDDWQATTSLTNRRLSFSFVSRERVREQES